MNQPNKRVIIGILAAGIITATIATLGMAKVFNFATAQFQVPFQTQPRLPQPQQPSAATTTTTSAASGGPNCNGCITTQNLANGAVTNPKLGPLSVSSANIGDGQVATGKVADQAVTTQKIAPGAVSISTTQVSSTPVGFNDGNPESAVATCPAGSIVTGGGYEIQSQNRPGAFVSGVEILRSDENAQQNGWEVFAGPDQPLPANLVVTATCATIHP